MTPSRNLLARSCVLALLLGALSIAWSGPARAETSPLIIDDYSNAAASNQGTRSAATQGSGSFSVTGGAGRVTVPGANGVQVALTYTFGGGGVDLTTGGATWLQLDYSSTTSNNPNQFTAVANFSLTVTDTSNRTSQAFGSVSRGQSSSVMAYNTPTIGISGSADLSAVKSLLFQFLPGSNQSNFNQVVDIDQLRTVNPNGQPANQSQTISFTSTPPDPATINGTYTATATGGGSGNPVTFSVGAGTTNGACTRSGATFTFRHAGTCVIAANQAGGTGYDAATQVTQSTTVAKSAQATSFTSTPPASPAVGGTYAVSATGGGSGNPVTFSVGAGTTNGACTLVGSTVSFVHVGTCVVAADQAGNADYNAATQNTQTLSVGKGSQTISFTSTAPASPVIGGSYPVTATGGGSGNPVTFSVGAGTTNGACTLAGSTVSFVHAGTCVVAADQAGDADHNAATQNTQTLSVGKIAQAIIITSTPPDPGSIGGTYAVAATGGGSGNPVTFSVGAGTTNGACTLAGSTFSFAHAGTCVVAADQAGSGDYSAAPQKTQSITVDKTPQTIAFTSSAPASGSIGGSYSVSATGGGSGNPVTFSVDAATTNGACTVAGSTVSFVHAGVCVVGADQAGNSDHSAAARETQSINVGKSAQGISFTSSPPSPGSIGGSYTVAATGGGSGNPVAFSVGAGTTNGACTVVGSTVSFVHAGTCEVAADQAGNGDYNPAPQETQSITVAKTAQTITFTSSAPGSGSIGGTYTVAATGGGSGNPVTFSVGAGTTNSACTVAGATVSFAHAGTCVVAADQAGDGDHDAAPTELQELSVDKDTQEVTFSSTAPSPAAIGATYSVTATGGGSGNPVTFSVGAGTTNGACTVAGATVSFVHAGTCVVAGDQAGDADHTAAPRVTQSMTVAKTAQAITFTSAPLSPAFVGTTYTLTALGGGSGSPVTFSTTSNACSLDGATVTFVAAGSCELDADQMGTADFEPAPRVTQIVAVTKVTSAVTVDTAPTATVYGQPATAIAQVAPALGTAAGTVQFSVDGLDVGAPVAVVGGTASKPLSATLGSGNHSIGAAFVPTDTTTFAAATGGGTLAVGKASTAVVPTITPGSLRAQVASTPPGAGTPTGTVRFLVDGTEVGTATLDGSGLAALTHTLSAGRSRTLAAAYDGDNNFLASSASTSRTDPTIKASVSGRPKASKAGWFRGKVTVSFTCAASGSPLASACPGPVVLKRNGAGHEVTRTVIAVDGGIGTASVGGINIDHRKPRVRLTGVRASGHYSSAPRVGCKAVDKLSGVASCRVHKRALKGSQVRYTAVATDKAGNRSRRSITISLSQSNVSILGLAAHDGAFDVRLGGSYTLVVIGGPRPRYVDAAPAPQRPAGLDAFFFRDGTVNGQPRWVLGVTITTDMGGHQLWNLGVLQGGRLHVVKVRVH